MPVETGGLEYPINVRDGFSATFGRFIRGSEAARQSYRDLKREIEKPTGNQTERESRREELRARRLRQILRELARENRGQLGIANAKRAATRQLTNEERKRNVEFQKSIQLQEKGFASTRVLISRDVAQARASRQVTQALNRRRQAAAALLEIQQRGLGTDLELKRQLGVLTAAERTALRVQQARVKAEEDLRFLQGVRSNEAIAQAKGEAAALRLVQKEREKAARDSALRGLGREDLIPGRKAAVPPPQTLTFFQRFNRILGQTDNQANRVSFTFRRLFGILAAFTVARRVIQGFNDIIRTIITANASIEQSTIGIAAVISAVGEVSDAYGNAVTGAEALIESQRIAAEQVRRLRIDALATTASFEELAEAFQVGLGPGLAAGLDVDQVRDFTRQISIAAQTIGLEQRQLAEEIRSILSGTINPRNTRIATVLGITNEDIRRAREAGTLFEFLQQEFAAFDSAGRLAAQSFNGLVARIRDGGRLLLAQGGSGVFGELKSLLSDTLDTLQQVDSATGQITLNPELLRAVAIVSDGLRGALLNLRDFSAGAGQGAFLDIAESLSAIFQYATRLVRIGAAIGRGALDALATIASIARFLASILGFVDSIFANIGSRALDNIFRVVGAILGTTTAIAIVVGGILPILRLVRIATLAIAAAAGIELRYRLGVFRIQVATLGITKLLSVKTLLITAAVLAVLAATGALSFILEKVNGVINGIVDKVTQIDKGILSASKNAQDGLTGAVRGTILALEDARKKVFDLREELADLRADNQAVLGTLTSPLLGAGLGSSSSVRDELAALNKISSESRKIISQLDEGIAAARRQQERLNEGFDDLARVQIPLVTDELRNVRNRILDLTEDNADFSLLFNEDSFRRDLENISRAANLTAEETVAALRSLQQRLQVELNTNLIQSDALFSEEGSRAIRAFRAASSQVAILINQFEQFVNQQNAENQYLKDRQTLLDQELDNALEKIRLNARRRTEELAITDAIEGRASALDAEAIRIRALGNETRANALEAQAAAERRREEFRISQNAAQQELDNLREIQRITKGRIDDLQANTERNREQEASLETALDLYKQITEQIDLQNNALDRAKTLNDALEDAENRRLERNRIESFGSIGEQAALALGDIYDQLPNRFDVILSTLRSSIQGFADFVSQALFDAFDPTKKGDIKARFGQFLQGLAQQVISTLIQIAVTAAVLNAASGGTLSTILGAFATGNRNYGTGTGFNEGGRIDRNTAARARAHPAHYRSPQGRHVGGVSDRPKGLHPTDRIPIWVAENEWVIKSKSAMKAGHDALARINAGAFNPDRLREALDLGGTPRRQAVAMAVKGPGYASGGRVRTDRIANGGGGLSSGPARAIVVASEDAAERLYRGGGNALDRELARRGIFPNG